MIRFFILIFTPLLLSANLTFISNYAKNSQTLSSFDIDSSFLDNEIMQETKENQTDLSKKERFVKTIESNRASILKMKNILAKYEVPPEFIYLAMAESYFLQNVSSPKKAAGFWQFIPSTAKVYGLKINKRVDERKNLVKSTHAAAKYLNKLYAKFGKWYLVAIAYNCGDGKLSRAIEEANSQDVSVLLSEDSAYIPSESKNYLKKVLSFAMMGSGDKSMMKNQSDHLSNIVKLYALKTPLEQEKKQQEVEVTQETKQKIHIVSRGDTLNEISEIYNTTYQEIMDLNGLKDKKLSLEQKLLIPAKSPSDSSTL